jgi:hypothetical protein
MNAEQEALARSVFDVLPEDEESKKDTSIVRRSTK